MSRRPYSGAGWIFRAGLTRGFREIDIEPDGVAFGFIDLGDLSALPAHRSAFRRVIPAAYPGMPSSRYPALISQFYWFSHGIEAGDLVALVDDFRGNVYLGRASGPYEYRPARAPGFNFRPVLWTSMLPLTQVPAKCREHWRARTGLFPMGPILGAISPLEGDALIKAGPGLAGP
jgi:predicted Mrr-cat superfamily restriction endonuclease